MAGTAVSKFSVANPNDPDSFQAGQPDKFVGTIISVLAYPYTGKESKDHKYYGFVGVRIRPDEDSGFEEFTRSYLGFYLNSGVPSKDGKTPAGGTDEAFAALSRGKENLDKPCLDDSRQSDRHVIPSHDNVGPYLLGKFIKEGPADQLFESIRESDTKKLLDLANPRLDFCVGARCRFDLVPERGRKNATPKEGEQERKILVVTDVLSVGEVKGQSTSQSTSSSTSAGSNGSDLGAAISLKIKEFLVANGGTAEVGTLMTKVSKMFDKGQKAAVMAWISEADKDSPSIKTNLIGIDGTEFDPDKGVLELE